MKLDRPKYHNLKPQDFLTATNKHGFDVCELKYDGWWGQLLLDGNSWQLFSRTGRVVKKGKLHNAVNRTLLHGEFIYGTEWAKDHLHLYEKLIVHGAESINGGDTRNISLSTVRLVINKFLDKVASENILGGITLTEQWPIERAAWMWETYVTRDDYEGLVFKNSNATWGAPFGRMKREVTMDYVCMGFEQSDSERHAGWGVASVLGGLFSDTGELFMACKVSGLTDAKRQDFFDNPNLYIGKVFMATGKKLSKNGALRHPNFEDWRTDKDQQDCKWPA